MVEKPVVNKPVVNKELPHTGDMAEVAGYGIGLVSLGLVGLARTALARRKKD